MGRGSSAGGGAKTLQKHFESENKRIKEFMTKPLPPNGTSIEMENGQIIERYTMKEMKHLILEEYKSYGDMPDDDAIAILYNDGKIAVYTGGDDTSKMKLSNIRGVIYENEMTSAYAGKGVKIENYYELYDNWSDDDWRLDFE